MNYEIIVSVFSFILSIFVFAFYLIDRHLKMVEISMNYRTQVLEWYEKCIQILKLIPIIKNNKEELEKAKARFSGLIEQGRFFFPNIDKKDGFGNDKVLHHRGYSNIIINFLTDCYNLIASFDDVEAINEYERKVNFFTAAVFRCFSPNDFIKKVEKVTTSSCSENLIREDLWNVEI